MKILGDSQILLFEELFSHLGETATYTGRTISAEQLDNVDVLITRSTVNVDKALLANTSVKFVGTCTIGIDHFDTNYLESKGIAWTNAAGCNANSVAQYVLSAMAQLSPNWLHSTVGIIGCGNIGGQVYRRLRALGVNCRVYDPFLSAADNPDLCDLKTVLRSDIVTSHAPLTLSGAYPSFHLLGEKELEQLHDNSLLISAGRGAVIDNQALLRKLAHEKNICVALDVWENEPNILTELIPLLDIVTPHIAGHSLEGKENGTVMVYEKLCEFLQMTPPIASQQVINRDTSILAFDGKGFSPEALFNQLLLAVYPIMEDDQRLRNWSVSQGAANSTADYTIAEHFDHLRKHYPVRREYSHFIFPPETQQAPINAWLNALIE
jgi:erythronate-4-phosphate dehydrogenase